MTPDTGTHVVVADTHQTDGVGGIIGQSGKIDLLGQLAAGTELEGDGQVVGYQPVHATLYLLLVMATGLLVDVEAHLALLTLDMGIIGALTAEEALHRLVQQVLGGVCWGKLLLVVLVKEIIVHQFRILG